jgi:hypothetical protein
MPTFLRMMDALVGAVQRDPASFRRCRAVAYASWRSMALTVPVQVPAEEMTSGMKVMAAGASCGFVGWRFTAAAYFAFFLSSACTSAGATRISIAASRALQPSWELGRRAAPLPRHRQPARDLLQLGVQLLPGDGGVGEPRGAAGERAGGAEGQVHH